MANSLFPVTKVIDVPFVPMRTFASTWQAAEAIGQLVYLLYKLGLSPCMGGGWKPFFKRFEGVQRPVKSYEQY